MTDGSNTVRLGAGDDVIEVVGRFEGRINAGGGVNILRLPDLDIADLRFAVEGPHVRLETPRGSLVLEDQVMGDGNSGPIAQIELRGGVLVGRDEMRGRAVDGQGTPRDDVISGTGGDDRRGRSSSCPSGRSLAS